MTLTEKIDRLSHSEDVIRLYLSLTRQEILSDAKASAAILLAACKHLTSGHNRLLEGHPVTNLEEFADLARLFHPEGGAPAYGSSTHARRTNLRLVGGTDLEPCFPITPNRS